MNSGGTYLHSFRGICHSRRAASSRRDEGIGAIVAVGAVDHVLLGGLGQLDDVVRGGQLRENRREVVTCLRRPLHDPGLQAIQLLLRLVELLQRFLDGFGRQLRQQRSRIVQRLVRRLHILDVLIRQRRGAWGRLAATARVLGVRHEAVNLLHGGGLVVCIAVIHVHRHVAFEALQPCLDVGQASICARHHGTPCLFQSHADLPWRQPP